MPIYILQYGYFSIDLLIFSSVTLDRPIFTAFLAGLAVGGILEIIYGLKLSAYYEQILSGNV
jgi:hypothetical protein